MYMNVAEGGGFLGDFRHTARADPLTDPAGAQFGGRLAVDASGYVLADERMRTSVPGVYAVGDVRSKPYRQITTATADGTVAAIAISKELG